MIDKKYLTKEIVPEYEVKKKTIIAIHSSGNQYKVHDLKEFLNARGFDTKKSAENSGWRFK